MKKIVRNVLYAGLGVVLYAIGISWFLDPNNLAPGGLIGLAVILNRLTQISTGTLYFVLNVPIVLLGIWKFGFKFMSSTAAIIAFNSVLTDILAQFGPLTTEPLLATIAGGVLIGAGIGMIFRAGTTSGGTDIIVKVIKTKYKHIRTGMLFLLLDMVIVSISGLVFKDFNVVMYAFIAVFLSGRVMDTVLYGSDEARLVYIISEKYVEIAKRALEELDVGMTLLEGKGAYTNMERRVIMCVMRKQISPKLEDIVKSVDPNSFMIVTSASEIYGEGYKDIRKAKL